MPRGVVLTYVERAQRGPHDEVHVRWILGTLSMLLNHRLSQTVPKIPRGLTNAVNTLDESI